MEDSLCAPVIVEGDWTPDQTRTLNNKLQLYFGSKKKSNGGDCVVQLEEAAPRAAVYFRSEEVRERVLARDNHQITLENQTVKLRLKPASTPTNSDDVSDSAADSKTQKSEVEPGNGASAESKEESEESVQSVSVVLDNVSDKMPKDLLLMLVENISGLDDSSHSLEIIWETNQAVVTFSSPADVEKFLIVSQSSRKLEKHELTARPLEAAKSVRVEDLPPNMVKDMLELYFEKNWRLPDCITMIPDEQAAIVTFSDSKVVERICIKVDYVMRSIPVKIYPYYESLSTALYGEERPTWKMPEPFTECVHHAVWKFLLMKKLLKTINSQMHPYFCSVDLDNHKVKLSPLPSLLRQKDVTARDVDNWMSTAQNAFCQQMSQYTAFECPASTAAWKAAEKEIRSVVREDAYVVLDASKGILTFAGQADRIKHIRAPVENIILKAMSQIERHTNGVSEEMKLSPAMFYILKQDGLQKAALDISPDMSLSYNDNTQKLTISGLPAEVFQTKSWILERNMQMRKKHLDVHPSLLDFLKNVDPMDMSQDLFTSQGISAIYSVESKGLFLLGSSDHALNDAQKKIEMALSSHTLDVEDQEVLKLPNWVSLNQKLLDTYNSSRKRTVAVQYHPERRDKVMVAGFLNPVKEISRSLKEFIVNYSHVQETFRVESCAVVQYMDKKKTQDCSNIAKDNSVTVDFDSERPRIIIAGARLHVHKAKSCLKELTSALFTDEFVVDKPGAKKYFQSQGSLFLSTVMTEFSCVVVLRPDNQEDEEEENYEEENQTCYCKVKTASGVLVSVSKADICNFGVDAVVNAANEELQHIGGLALALLRAAGPQLQKLSNDYIAKCGKLSAGDAIVTSGCNLPCKHVVHAVGPRFSDYDRKKSVLLLKLAVKHSLREAEKVSCSSVALPAISSGVFGFPVELCAETIAEAVREYCDSPGSPGSLTEIHLVDNIDNTVRVLATAVNKQFIDLEPTMTIPQQVGGRGRGGSRGHQWGRGRGRGGNQSRGHWSNERGRGRGGARGGGGGRGGGREGGRGGGREGGRGGGRGGGREGEREGGRGRGGGREGGWEGGGPWANRGDQSPRGHAKSGGYGGPATSVQTTAEGLKIVLWKGNIQDQTTDVVVNTISEHMNLNQGAVSKAILEAAGSRLQSAVRSEAGATTLRYGDVVVTDGFDLMCRKVFHAVCPFWDNGTGQAEEELISIIRYCLEEAEKRHMTSISFPAIGTGNLSFPRDLVSRVLLKEIHSYSRRRSPRYLSEVAIVVHPSDSHTVDCFTREFKGQTGPRNVQHEAEDFNESPVRQSQSQSQQPSASFSQVSSPSLGMYRMQMGQLTLEVSSGDITKEASDVIINSSNKDFNLKLGVSKAILDSAGLKVELECSQIVSSPGYQPGSMILTSAGSLPSRNIIHIVGQKDPANIKDMVYSVLKVCEEHKLSSVSFPALGTGQGGADPSAVAEAMVGAVVEFVRKKQPRFVRSVKILIFQTGMVKEFHKSMTRRQGEEVEEKSVFTKIKDSFTALSNFITGSGEERTNRLVLDEEEFEPTVFQLCAENAKAVSQAKKKIEELIVAEQAQRTITEPFISKLSQSDMEELNTLQRKLTVSIRLDRTQEDQEPKIHLEGLTRDVFMAESAVRDIIRKVERTENERKKAFLVSGLVEWQFPNRNGTMMPFDIYTNLILEEALENKEKHVKIKINNETYKADVKFKKAVSANGRKEVELLRKDLRAVDAALPAHWDDMKGDLLKLFPVTAGSKEYNDVQTELTKTGLSANIISIERVQNETLWQSYQLMKKNLEVKNKHKNNEKMLFHGTGSNSIDHINKQGFNRSYAGAHAAMYGNGSYFAVDPVYSARGYSKPDARGHKRMYLARVLVGDFAQGKAGLITPPSKGSGNADLYDSVTDNTAGPTMFVIFSDTQAYPEYLITFT
ncbi:protein mono-ADP-ribosyltransferase PARP14-like isoform X1 [Scomber scombrus]|uniref:protein mono-ADP-ribosyltransferase PARP14-like isoform X1 n=1 Tax=Scomber scombrus TaxID=13677 RepID=UPI002DD7FA95|nr:protein mono-ADP-ribosyltransferase PARP14-like isoform X1 [Scomber scombrus]